MEKMEFLIKNISKRKNTLFGGDFLLTWEKSLEELEMVMEVAEVLKFFHDNNISPKCFDSGLAVSIFRDQSTRTRFSFASAANLLGLEVADMDEEKSQISHGETVRETAVMISFLTRAIGIRDDMFVGLGDRYMREVGEALNLALGDKILVNRPPIINLQSDLDHPTQSMSDLLHLKKYFGSLEALKGKKIAMTWAYSPSYGKPLSVPQGIIALLTRFGMEVSLAHPKGYDLLPDIAQQAADNARSCGGKFINTHSIEEAFFDADIVYPKSWAPYSVMQKRTELLGKNDHVALDVLEKDGLRQNALHAGWECTEELMKTTKNGKALYMHCLPADITGVSCEKGEVESSVFDRYRKDLYQQAGLKPYIIAAMMLTSLFEEPATLLSNIDRDDRRIIQL